MKQKIEDSPKGQWLKEYRAMWQKMEHTHREILRWRSIAEKVTPTFSAAPSRFYADGNRIERSAEALDALRLQLADELSSLADRRFAMERAICSVPDERLRLFLRLRYIDGLTFADISEEMDLTLTWLFRLRTKALDQIQIDDLHAEKQPEKRTKAGENGQ